MVKALGDLKMENCFKGTGSPDGLS
jgi:hypothetical protein